MRKTTSSTSIIENMEIGNFIIIITAVVTVIASVLPTFWGEGTLVYDICDKTFYISLSSLLVEITWSISSMKKSLGNIEENTNFAESIVFPDKDSVAVEAMQTAYSNSKATHMKIICYGTSQFGNVVQTINQYHKTINLEVIVCDPQETVEADRERLKQTIKEMAEGGNTKVYLSKIPPTLRACLVTSEMTVTTPKNFFCMIQPYQIYNGAQRFRGAGQTPIILAKNEDSPIVEELSTFFLAEWERLFRSSTQYERENEGV